MASSAGWTGFIQRQAAPSAGMDQKKSGAGIPDGTPTPLGGGVGLVYGCRSSVPQLAGWTLTPLSLACGQYTSSWIGLP